MARMIKEPNIFGINLEQSHGDRGLNSMRLTAVLISVT
jgi:hypothetical protein